MAISKTAGSVYSRTTNLPSIALFTIIGWIYLTADTDGQEFAYFGGNPSGNRYGLEYQGANNLLNIANTAENNPGQRPLLLDAWYHMGWVLSGTGAGQSIVYLNGDLDLIGNGNPTNTTGILRLGGGDGGIGYAGRMAHWKIYDAALTQAEVRAEMTRADPVRTANLNAYYPFNSTADDETDFSGNGRTLTVSGSFSNAAGPIFLPRQRAPLTRPIDLQTLYADCDSGLANELDVRNWL